MTASMLRDRGAGAVFVISAPSGAGKSTLVRRLVESVGGLRFSVSHTTRDPRPDEREGVDYHFVNEVRFRQLHDAGGFLESAEVHGRLYGTSRAAVESIQVSGDDALLDLDVQGAQAVRAALPQAVLIFVLPPAFSELRRRLQERGTAETEIARRLETAAREIRCADRFDYLVVNEVLEEAEGSLESIVLAERCRTLRRMEALDRIGATFPAAR